MDELRTPCVHRGGTGVINSPLTSEDGDTLATLCVCSECRRFWLERDGWLLSKRETMALMRSLPFGEDDGRVLAR